MEYCSVIMTVYRHGEREGVAKKSITSLLQNTTYPFEFILVDNTQNNRGLGLARNAGYDIATGNFICFTDDDIDFKAGWLEECIKLVQMGTKYIATPVWQPRVNKWELPPVNGYRQNYRTGSNCMVMRPETFEDIGRWIEGFPPAVNVVKIGHKYSDMISRKGYTFLITKEPMAEDIGLGHHSYLQNGDSK